MKSRHWGIVLVLTSAAGFATLAVFIKFAYAAGANTTTVLTFRFLFAALFFWLTLRQRGISGMIPRRTIMKIALLGALGYGLMSTLFASTLLYLPASLSGMLLYTYPAMVTIEAMVLGDERCTVRKLSALAICFAGLYMVLDASFSGVNPVGIILGISAALVYSLYIVASNRVLKETEPLIATTWVCTAAAIVFLLWGTASGDILPDIGWNGWWAIGGMAVFATYVAILAFFAGMREVGPASASIISTVEPVITVILSFILLGEHITMIQAIGGMAILAGVIVLESGSKAS